MKKIAFILFSVFIIFSCSHTVEFVRKDTSPIKQGVVRYSPTNNKETESKYLDDFKKKANFFCSGDYVITREYQALGESRSSTGAGLGFGIGGSSSVMFGGSRPNSTLYNFIEFSCK